MTFNDYIQRIYAFFRDSGVQIDPLPKVRVDMSEADVLDPFIRTANYSAATGTITIFARNRQLKDILRSFCHELVHHSQHLEDPEGFAATNKAGNLADNPELERLEADAYTRGNLLFRRWTELERPRG